MIYEKIEAQDNEVSLPTENRVVTNKKLCDPFSLNTAGYQDLNLDKR